MELDFYITQSQKIMSWANLFSRDSSVNRGGDTFTEETGIQGVEEVEGW